MIRVEIICNQSIQDILIQNIENQLPDVMYTIIPMVQGKGKDSYKIGDSTWPELNFLLLTYCDDIYQEKIIQIVNDLKHSMPNEGIKIFIIHDK